ncbi:sugar ABC transporter substrate-binding protein [Rathayibacter tanaceti]|uniref:D-ribose-binding periplasmic protein n=2 Tax=Rathayibacter tanaceti TaxID=1671680 RepID=A0A162GFG1_9MICO|nr:sugar ABC transporter substrate-binding protein [Rathayibacter tanaceti]KZX20329.1 D-ribose-binding periplasmic protein precursor [Rathayibacter tanaceti]QHC55329.1 substrate-binding domain-containing protein [Rathayibacter tanaceti]TCO36370.1 ribose transport system substrate-binding protein [Rathayibacter tanaceti]
MRRSRTLTASVALLAAAALVLSGCSLKTDAAADDSGAAPAAASAAVDVPSLEGKTIGVAAKDIVHDFSRIVYESVQNRIEALGGEVVATQAEAKDDKHVSDIENLVSQKPDAIIVILGDATTLAPALQEVDDAGIPLFTIDNVSPLSINNATSDNWQIGSTLARTIAEDIGGQGQILVFNGFPGVAPCRIRYNELALVLEDYPGITLIQPELQDKYEGTIEDAKQQITDALSRYPKGEISAIWSCWDTPQIGAAQAVDAAGRDEIKIYGVDADQGALDLIQDPASSYTATVAQQTEAIGNGSAENVARYLGGEADSVPTTSYFAPVLITKDNAAATIEELGLDG